MVSWWDFDLKVYNSVYKLHLWENAVVIEYELYSSLHVSAALDIDIWAQCKLECKFKGFSEALLLEEFAKMVEITEINMDWVKVWLSSWEGCVRLIEVYW